MDLSTVNEDDRCQTCGNTYKWHQENHPRHPFNSGQDGATDFLKRKRGQDDQRAGSGAQRGSEGPQIVSTGNDPVLRIALINRGILSPADLVIAEEQLRVALSEVQHAQSAEGARGRQVQVGEAASVDVGGSPGSGQEVGSQPEDHQG